MGARGRSGGAASPDARRLSLKGGGAYAVPFVPQPKDAIWARITARAWGSLMSSSRPERTPQMAEFGLTVVDVVLLVEDVLVDVDVLVELDVLVGVLVDVDGTEQPVEIR